MVEGGVGKKKGGGQYARERDDNKSLTSNLPQVPCPEQALGHSAAASPTRDAARITFNIVREVSWNCEEEKPTEVR
jgi:hypothetical protein